jgi:hypothetical protein
VFHLLEECSEKPTKPKKKEVTNKYRIFCRLNHSNGKDYNHLGENVDRFPSYQDQVIFNILASVKKLEDLTHEGLTREIQSLNAEVILVKEMYESSYKKSQKLKEANQDVKDKSQEYIFLLEKKENHRRLLQNSEYEMHKLANRLYSAKEHLRESRESSQRVIHHSDDDIARAHQIQEKSYIEAKNEYEFYLRMYHQIDSDIARTTESLARAQQALQALQATRTAN